MNDGLLLIIAIGVFSLMVIGLGLTIYEFREHIIEDPLKKNRLGSIQGNNLTG